MVINETGNYILEYSATDECGHTTVRTRQLTVTEPAPPEPDYRTVLYNDGTFIINEYKLDSDSNRQRHGQEIGIYDALDAGHPYVFANRGDRPWDNKAGLVETVEFGSTIEPTSTAHWFESMEGLTDINWEHLYGGRISNTSYMFSGCRSLTEINMDEVGLNEVEDMSYMLSGCDSAASISVGRFPIYGVRNVSGMFAQCASVEEIDLSDVDLTQIEDTSSMFEDCGSLTSIRVGEGKFDTQNVTNMNSMFAECSQLQFDTSMMSCAKVTNMSYMFSGCTSMRAIDLSKFDTTGGYLEAADEMFARCESLQAILATSNFVIDSNVSSTDMFADMSSDLMGGAGTIWSPGNANDGTYAHIDGGESNPGYFTEAEQ